MKKPVTMTQCKLERKGVIDTAWIPTEFAIKGNYLEIKGINGWEIIKVWTTMETNEVRENERDHKKTRIASDIPRGKIKGDLMKEINAKNNRDN